MQVKKQQLELDMEQWIGSELGKEYDKAVYCYLVYLTSLQSTCKMPGWMNHKLKSRLLGEISATSDAADNTSLMAKSEKELKSLLMKVKKESEKVGLKLNTWKTKIMTSGPMASWQIDVETMEMVSDFIFLGSKITADGDCNHEIKRHLLLRRKAMTNLDSILKSRDIILPTKVHLVKLRLFQ